MKYTKKFLVSMVVFQIAITACGTSEQPGGKATDVISITASAVIEEALPIVDTSTQIPEPSPSLPPTEIFTTTVSPTSEPPPLPQVTVISDFTSIRSGPGTMYAVVATATKELVLDIEGRSWAGNWLATPLPWGDQGWVFAPDVTNNIDVGALPVIVVAEPTESPVYTITVSNRTGGELVISIHEIRFNATFISSSPKSFTLSGGTYIVTMKVLFGGPPCIVPVTIDSDVYWEPTIDNLCPPN